MRAVGFLFSPKAVNVVKSIAEIADEYDRNLIRLKLRRDEVALLIRAEQCAERRWKLHKRVEVLERMIFESAGAIAVMRGERHG